jgi:type IV secretory pathway VirB3-like protein
LENLAQWLGLNRQQKFGKSYNVRFYGSSEYHFNYIKHNFDRSDH